MSLHNGRAHPVSKRYGGRGGCVWTTGELLRAHELATRAMLPTGSIALLLSYEFGTNRTAVAVRSALRTHFDWHGKPRGDPSKIHKRRDS